MPPGLDLSSLDVVAVQQVSHPLLVMAKAVDHLSQTQWTLPL